jgi:hypothetical protein
MTFKPISGVAKMSSAATSKTQNLFKRTQEKGYWPETKTVSLPEQS